MRPIDIVDVKAGINAGRLYVAVKGKYLLLGDYQTGESIRLSDIEVKPVVHAAWLPVCEMWDDGVECDEYWYVKCSRCGMANYNVDTYQLMDGNLGDVKREFPYCHCGAKMDGDPDG